MQSGYHWELYANKRCSKAMDEVTTSVDADTPILKLANLLLSSSNSRRLSEGFVITRGKKFLGTGLTSDVMAAILTIERRQAKELAKTNERLHELTITDPLTGLHNRRHFDDVMDAELRRAQRDRQSVGLIMLDIDHFKKLNDKLGHQAGDETLRKVAGALQSCLRRPSDYCFRIGGEEFAVMAMDASTESISALAEKLRSKIEELRLPNPDHPLGMVTISAGAALSIPNSENTSQLFARADKAMYRAKSSGRNRVVLSQNDIR